MGPLHGKRFTLLQHSPRSAPGDGVTLLFSPAVQQQPPSVFRSAAGGAGSTGRDGSGGEGLRKTELEQRDTGNDVDRTRQVMEESLLVPPPCGPCPSGTSCPDIDISGAGEDLRDDHERSYSNLHDVTGGSFLVEHETNAQNYLLKPSPSSPTPGPQESLAPPALPHSSRGSTARSVAAGKEASPDQEQQVSQHSSRSRSPRTPTEVVTKDPSNGGNGNGSNAGAGQEVSLAVLLDDLADSKKEQLEFLYGYLAGWVDRSDVELMVNGLALRLYEPAAGSGGPFSRRGDVLLCKSCCSCRYYRRLCTVWSRTMLLKMGRGAQVDMHLDVRTV